MASASALPNLYQGVDKQSFGYKLLENFGWKEGQGLGANKQGIKEHVKVKKKQDALGVGAAEQAHKLRDWTTGMVGGNKAQKANAAKKRKKNEEATSGSGSAAGADNTQEGSAAAHQCKHDSSAAATAVAAASISRSKAATHLGRYQRREAAKTVRNYSAGDLAAILGLPGAAPTAAGGEGAGAWAAAVAAPAAGGSTSSNSSSDDDDDDGDSEGDGEAAGGSDQLLRPGTPPGSDSTPGRPRHQQSAAGSGGGNAELKAAGHAAEDVAGGDACDVPASSWWRSVFVKSGGTGAGSGSSRPGKAIINISGFLEADQTNLYMQASNQKLLFSNGVHEGATKNKQGLGRSGMPKKVAGARWMGKKTRLGSDKAPGVDTEQLFQQVLKKLRKAEGLAVCDKYVGLSAAP
eukprot:gene12820-12947_t